MNVLMLSDVYFPRVNGVSTSMQTACRELVRMGHAVTVVAPDYGSADAAGDIEIMRLPSRKIFFDPEDRLIKRSALNAALQDLAQRRFDVIHIHTPFRAHELGVRLRRLSGCPAVESYHTYFEQYVAHYLPWMPQAATRLAVRAASRRLVRGIDHLIVPTEEMAAVLRGYGIATPASVIPTGILLDEFAGGDGALFRQRLGLGARQPTLVTVSRVAAEKNIDFLLEVVDKLRVEFANLVFVIAGEGPDEARLKQITSRLGLGAHVRFVGNLDRRTTLLDCYRAADVFVFASGTETQGLVLIEAMALGVPIVSTAQMGTATVLAGARSARVSAKDVGEFASHVAALLRSSSARAALAAEAPADAQRWSAPALMQRVADLYASLPRLSVRTS